MYEDEIVKKIVKRVFDKVKQECLGNSPNALCGYLHSKIDIIGTRTITRVYNSYILKSKGNHTPSPNTVNAFCKYLGYNDYSAYIKAFKTEILLQKMSYSYLQEIGGNQIRNFIRHLSKNIKDKTAHEYFWKGILILKLRQYDEAINNISQSVLLDPSNEEHYYNLALAKFKGKQPYRLTISEIFEIQDLLNTAFRLNTNKRKFYTLQYIINEDFYKRHGLSTPKKIERNQMENLEIDIVEVNRMFELLDLSKNSTPGSKYYNY